MHSPLDQFDIFYVYILKNFFFDFKIIYPNVLISFSLLIFLLVGISFYFSSLFQISFFYVQILFEFLYSFVFSTLGQQIGRRGGLFFPFFFIFFLFLLFSNVLGLTPFTSTVTSHFIVGFSIALLLASFFVIVTVFDFSFDFIRCYIPDVPFFIIVLLLFVEFFSVNIKAVSLAIRLSANITADILWFLLFLLLFLKVL